MDDYLRVEFSIHWSITAADRFKPTVTKFLSLYTHGHSSTVVDLDRLSKVEGRAEAL
jgi:hypothetical protein